MAPSGEVWQLLPPLDLPAPILAGLAPPGKGRSEWAAGLSPASPRPAEPFCKASMPMVTETIMAPSPNQWVLFRTCYLRGCAWTKNNNPLHLRITWWSVSGFISSDPPYDSAVRWAEKRLQFPWYVYSQKWKLREEKWLAQTLYRDDPRQNSEKVHSLTLCSTSNYLVIIYQSCFFMCTSGNQKVPALP